MIVFLEKIYQSLMDFPLSRVKRHMVKESVLVYLTFGLNALIDKGLSVPLEEVKGLWKEKKAIEELERKFPLEKEDRNRSPLEKGTKAELDEIFQSMATTIDEQKKFGIENNGLCLLIAYCQEQIQREHAKYYTIKIV